MNFNLKDTAFYLFVAISIFIMGYFFYGNIISTSLRNSACEQEVKQCPDGLYVARAGPRCAFAPCFKDSPQPLGEGVVWKKYQHKTYKFLLEYPENWSLEDFTDTTKYEEPHIAIKSPDQTSLRIFPQGSFLHWVEGQRLNAPA